MKNAKASNKKFIEKNPLESLLDIGGGALDSLANDFLKGVASATPDQVLGIKGNEKRKETAGDLTEGEELVLSGKTRDQKNVTSENLELEQSPYQDIEPGIDYKREILYGEKRIASETQRELSREIKEILEELKRIITSSKDLEIAFADISTTEQIINPGEYHKSFFELLLSIVKEARLKVEDSGAWLAMFKSKKAKRNYWEMFKKHGTTFGLSNERVVATQTG